MNKQSIVLFSGLGLAVALYIVGICIWITAGMSPIVLIFTLSSVFVVVVTAIIQFLYSLKSKNVNTRKVTNWFISEWRASQWLDLASAFYTIPVVVYLIIMFLSENLFEET